MIQKAIIIFAPVERHGGESPVTPAPLGAAKVHGRRYRMVRTYEILFIVRPDYDDEQIASIIARYTDVITNQQGVVSTAEKWAKRRLAYEIDRVREGIYIIIIFEGSSGLADELDRRMKIDQEILRHMISRTDHVAGTELKPRRPRARTQEGKLGRDTKGQAAKPEAVVVSDDTSEEDSSEK